MPKAEPSAGLLPLARLLQFGDSTLPVGGFAFSSGLEAAAQTGLVKDAATLRGFVRTLLDQAARGDAVALLHAARAALGSSPAADAPGKDGGAKPAEPDFAMLLQLDAAVFRRKTGEEARLMSTRMGRKLTELSAALPGPGAALGAAWLARVKAGLTPGTWPVALAVHGVASGLAWRGTDGSIHTDALLTLYLYNVAAGALNASLRLLRVTHLEAQQTLYALLDEVDDLEALTRATAPADMNAFAPMTDILAALHERAHVRLFMN